MHAAALLFLIFASCARAADSGPKELSARLDQDFKSPLGPGFQMFGAGPAAGIQTDRLGLRINLSPARQGEDGVGVATRFRISGDFDITLSYAVLSSQQPEKGFGAGMKVWLQVGDHPKRNVTLAHFRRLASENEFVAMVATFDENNKKTLDMKSSEAVGTSGRVRLVRTGSLLKFLAADEKSDEFRELHEAEVGLEDVQTMRIQATSSGAPVPVSVRLSDLAIRAEKLSIEGSPPPKSGWPQWAWWSGAIAVLGIATAIVIQRRRRRPSD